MTYQLDLLGRPVNVGDKVLVKGYGSMCNDTVADVLRVNKSSISINLQKPVLDWGEYDPVTRHYPNRKITYETKRMTRDARQCIVVNELLPISEAKAEQFVLDFPEYFI